MLSVQTCTDVTLAEEETLLSWAALAAVRLARSAGLDRAVVCTALVFLRRFYLSGSLAEYPPDEMMCVGGRGRGWLCSTAWRGAQR